nr:hypothetical protein [uncultured Lacibacter sp.]
MDKIHVLEELEQVTDFLNDLPLTINPQQAIIDNLNYAVHLINELQEDPSYTSSITRLNNCILELSSNKNHTRAVSVVLPVAIATLRKYNRLVSKRLGQKRSFLQRLSFVF